MDSAPHAPGRGRVRSVAPAGCYARLPSVFARARPDRGRHAIGWLEETAMTTPVLGIQTDHPTDPEDRLALNRVILRQRLARLQAPRAPGALGALAHHARAALPQARRKVAENPNASLGGGM